MRRFITVVSASLVVAGFAAGPAVGAQNPSGTGQPGVECGDPGATSGPAGFDTDGFANAEDHYAHGENNDHAVSQYDVACYQFTSSH
jgi:hypothetical protein